MLMVLAAQLSFLFPLVLKAQNREMAEPFVTIELILQDSAMLKNFQLQFEMCKNEVNSHYNSQDVDLYTYKINDIKTQIKVPLSTKVNYGSIKCFYDNQVRIQPFNEEGLSIYIFEQGDKIRLIISKKTIHFEGENTEKYNCIQKINLNPIFDETQENIFARQKKYENLFEFYKVRLDSAFNHKKEVLKQYQLKLSPEVYNLILADCQGYYYANLLGTLKGNISPDAQMKKMIVKFYKQWFKDIDLLNLDEKTLVNSYRFCDFLFNKAQYETQLVTQLHNNHKTSEYTFSQIYDYIQKNHTGIIRDKITYLTFSFLMIYHNGRPYLETAYKQMSNNIFKTYLSNISANFSKPIYQFELFDQYGTLRKLEEFKGKLLVLDFWFTGCGACAKLAIELKPIIEYYKNDERIEFISISTDEEKKRWLKSVSEETYSDKNQINLFTNGLGSEHPIIKNYKVQAFPALFLISKEGEILTTSIPRPIKGRPETVTVFKKLISKNL